MLEYEIIEKFFLETHFDRIMEEGKVRKIRRSPPSWFNGGPVPKKLLFKDENVKVLQLDLIPAVDIVYRALPFVRSLAKTKYDEHVGIRLIPKVLHAAERRNIPQNFAPGILLMYLEHCERCPWRFLIPTLYKEKREALDQQELLMAAGKEEEAKAILSDWHGYMVDQIGELLAVGR
jgi:hypothetical protein